MSEFKQKDFRSLCIDKVHAGGVEIPLEYGEDKIEPGEYSAVFTFQGRENSIENKKIIHKDVYSSVTIHGKSIRELLESSINFIMENNI